MYCKGDVSNYTLARAIFADMNYCVIKSKISSPLFFFLTIVLGISIQSAPAQIKSVPFRIGDKFGLADTNGKMIIEPQFDILDVGSFSNNYYFVGYKLKDGIAWSSLIVKDKIIIKDQKYKFYYQYDDLFLAIEYKHDPSGNTNEKKNPEFYSLYNTNGKKISEETFRSLYVIEDIDPEKKLNEMLVGAIHLDKKESIFVYDKKSKKISKILIDKTSHLENNYNWENDYRDLTAEFIYQDQNGKVKKMKINNSGSSLKILSDEPATIEKNRDDYRGYDDVMVPMEDRAPVPPAVTIDSIILDIRKVEIKRGFYWLPKKVESINITNEKLKKESYYIVSKDGFVGLKLADKEKLIIPVIYHEIMKAESAGMHGTHILRKDSLYGLFIYRYPEDIIIEPVFDKIPLLAEMNYFKKHEPLLKLYNEDGTFFCYADEHGKLFYKE